MLYVPKGGVIAAPNPSKFGFGPYRPWEGIDRARWPNTFATLMLFFYGGEWWGITKQVNTWGDHRGAFVDNDYYLYGGFCE